MSDALRLPAGRGLDIVSLGEPLYELAQEADGRFASGLGGDTSNAAIAAARLGASTAYVTQIGDDLFGEALRALWEREGVDHSAVTISENAPTGVYFITYANSAHHFTYLRKGSAASLLRPEQVPEALIARAKFLHVSGISLAVQGEVALHAMALARAAGTLVSLDTNYRPRLWSKARAVEAMAEALRRADLVKTSLEDAQALFSLDHPLAISRRIGDAGAVAAVITEGAEGATGWTAATGLFKQPRFPVDALDATGAGDAFAGALLAFLSESRDFRTAVAWANAAAGLSTLTRGATAGLPRRDAVMAALRAR